ncbi:MAG: STAS/SEC14 domain-containing protein [Alphaproteobacteria bacterium]
MTYKLTILPQSELCLIAYSGRVTEGDLEAVRAALHSSSDHRPHFDELVAIGPDADYSEVSFEIARVRAQRYVANESSPIQLKRLAFVCANEVQLAMARLFDALVKADGPSNLEVNCFQHLSAAVAWLEQAKAAGSIDRAQIRSILAEMGHAWCCSEEV